MEPQYFQVKIPVLTKPRYKDEATDRDYREDSIVFSVKAETESEAVSVVSMALSRLVAHKAIGTDRVFETI